MKLSHRSHIEERIDLTTALIDTDRVTIERPVFSLVRYYLDGKYVVTRGMYQLLCEHELPDMEELR